MLFAEFNRRVVSLVRTAADSLADLFYPPVCAACGRAGGLPGLCAACFEQVVFAGPDHCLRCGRILGPYSGRVGNCSACRSFDLNFRRGFALCRYNRTARAAIHAFKYRRDFAAAGAIGRMIAAGVPRLAFEEPYDRIIPVPMHLRDQARRGFNQSALIAARLGRSLGLPVSDLLVKERLTNRQVGLKRAERKTNLEGAFTCRPGAADGETVLLVDDVLTTGSTLSMCARTLKREGRARVVDVFVIAR